MKLIFLALYLFTLSSCQQTGVRSPPDVNSQSILDGNYTVESIECPQGYLEDETATLTFIFKGRNVLYKVQKNNCSLAQEMTRYWFSNVEFSLIYDNVVKNNGYCGKLAQMTSLLSKNGENRPIKIESINGSIAHINAGNAFADYCDGQGPVKLTLLKH